MGVNNAATYLRGEIRLPVVEREWPEAADLSLHLARGISYRLCSFVKVGFAMVGIR